MAINNKEESEFEEDFTPKTAKRKITRKMVIIAASAILFIVLVISGYFIYDGTIYYRTNNAKVDTVIYQLSAKASGKLVKINVAQDEAVTAGQDLARVYNGPRIYSPIDGTVIDVKMHDGDYVTPADVVVIVAETSDMYITANVEETDILKIHKGQNALVTLDAYGASFPGVVSDVNTITSSRLNGAATSFTTSGTYTKVTQLFPVKIKLLGGVNLTDIIGTNATVKIRIR